MSPTSDVPVFVPTRADSERANSSNPTVQHLRVEPCEKQGQSVVPRLRTWNNKKKSRKGVIALAADAISSEKCAGKTKVSKFLKQHLRDGPSTVASTMVAEKPIGALAGSTPPSLRMNRDMTSVTNSFVPRSLLGRLPEKQGRPSRSADLSTEEEGRAEGEARRRMLIRALLRRQFLKDVSIQPHSRLFCGATRMHSFLPPCCNVAS